MTSNANRESATGDQTSRQVAPVASPLDGFTRFLGEIAASATPAKPPRLASFSIGTFYIVITDSKKYDPYVSERSVKHMNRADVIADIASGELSDVAQVIEFSVENNSCCDVTEEIAREVDTHWATHCDGLDSWQVNFVEQHITGRMVSNRERAA